MKKINTLILICLVALIESCSSVPLVAPAAFDSIQFDRVQLGQSEQEVKKFIGEPMEIKADDESNQWYYFNRDENAFQRAAVSFDLKDHQVIGVTIIPFEKDPDSKLDYLKKQKFPTPDYVEAPLGRCKRDYFPSQVFYISPSKGIIIEQDSVHNLVESYSWTTSQYAKDLISKIKNCQR